MGQSESADNEDGNCFRACVKQKKEKSKKIQAFPCHPQHKDSRFDRKQLDAKMAHQEYNQPASSPTVHNNNNKIFETSLDYRLSCQQGKLKKKISLQKSANLVTNVLQDGCTLQKSHDGSLQMVLGLQSKFSSTKQAYSFTTAKIISQKGNIERNSAGTRCSSHEKQSASQSQITNKTNQTSATSKGRKMLMNKIEEIKQKYYERELEIQICHDEREYQEQVEKIDHIDRTIVQKAQVPQRSIGEIKVMRNKILAKLREKKQRKLVEKETGDEPSLHQTVNQSLTVQDQLEIYSKEGKVLFQDTFIQSQSLKKSKNIKNRLMLSGKDEENRSTNSGRPDCSVEQKIQFSNYSEDNLRQIRELDEQYEDYRSKVTGLSKFTGINYGQRPQTSNQPTIPRSQIASRNSVDNSVHSDLQPSSSNPKKPIILEQNPPISSTLSIPNPKNQPPITQSPKNLKTTQL